MNKKVTSLALVLAIFCSFLTSPAMKVQAEEKEQVVEPTTVYSSNKITTIANGSGAIEATKEDVAIFKDLESFTMNTTLTMNTGSSTVQSIFFIGDSTQNLNYVSIYFIPAQNKIGIESKSGGINTSFVSPVNITDGQSHKFTFTVSKGNYYRFYVDGKKANEGNSPTTFTKGVVPNADHMMLGNGKRSNNGNGYPLNGTLKNVELYNSAISEEQILLYHEDTEEGVFTYKNAYYNNISDQKYESNSEESLTNFKALDNGSITVRYRASSDTNGVMSLFSLSDSTNSGKYLNFYVNPKDNAIGVEVLGTASGTGNFILNNNVLSGKGVSIKNTNWHTVTVIKTNSTSNNRYTFYIDGKKIDQYSDRIGFTNNVDTADTISVGHVKRLNNTNNMAFIGAIDYVKVLDRVLEESEIQQLHKVTMDVTTSELDLTNAYKTEANPIFYTGYKDSNSYRIPSLLTTKDGTVIAAIDKRNQHWSDWGDIDTMVRRKEAGSEEFDEGQVILDLADNRNGGDANSAFLIDPAMVQDKETGRIYMIVDMYPESQGLGNSGLLKTGTGYKKIDGEDYQVLYDASNNEYTVREGGKVYNADGNLTEYTMTTECEAPYKELGNIYKNGEYKGNAYLFSGSDKGELNILRTSYIWLMHSDDDGKTWSLPKDITPQIKKDWMKFIGVGPGVGIQIENGNLIFPIYHTNENVGVSQSSAVIISEDKGETWSIGESPMKTLGRDPETMTSGGMLTESQVIQINNGELKLFMRNTIANTLYVATSNDGGRTWYKVENDPNVPEIYCQLSVINYEKDGKEYVMLSNPETSGRKDGKVRLGEIAADGSIKWTNSQFLDKGHFQYSCLTQLPDDKFAVLYELDDANGNIGIYYTEFDEAWVKANNKTVDIPNPNVKLSNAVVQGNKFTVNLELTQKVMVAGQPTLTLKIGNKTLDAAYMKGSGTDKLVFEATLNGDEVGMVTAVSINETNGIIENALGGNLPEINKELYDLTRISKESYEGVTYTSQHSNSTAENTDGAAINVIDGNKNTYWHSTWGNSNINLPQSVTLELKEETEIYKLSYLPRQNQNSGRIKNYDILTSTDGTNFTKIVSGTFLDSTSEQSVEFTPVNAKYIKFQATYAYGGGLAQSAAVAELGLYKYDEGVFGDVDKSLLEEKVKEIKELIKGAYSEASIARVQEELTKAEEILNESIVSQSMIDSAFENISDAEANLINISNILKYVKEFEGLNSRDYTEISWEFYRNSIEEAKAVAKEATTKKQVTNVLKKVDYAKANLVKVEAPEVDKTLLGIVIDYAKDAKSKGALESVIPSVVKEFELALKVAEDIFDDSNATVEQVNLAEKKLTNAIWMLEFKKGDKTELTTLVEIIDCLDENKYTTSTWNSLQVELAKANNVIDDEDAMEKEITDAYDGLIEAFTNLINN